MKKSSKFLKAFGVAASSAYAWATFVVTSPSGPITAPEWLLLGGLGLGVLVVWGVPNIGYATPLVPAEPVAPVAEVPAPPAPPAV